MPCHAKPSGGQHYDRGCSGGQGGTASPYPPVPGRSETQPQHWSLGRAGKRVVGAVGRDEAMPAGCQFSTGSTSSYLSSHTHPARSQMRAGTLCAADCLTDSSGAGGRGFSGALTRNKWCGGVGALGLGFWFSSYGGTSTPFWDSTFGGPRGECTARHTGWNDFTCTPAPGFSGTFCLHTRVLVTQPLPLPHSGQAAGAPVCPAPRVGKP